MKWSVFALLFASQTGAAVVFQENFDLGDRPRGNDGDLRFTDLNKSIGDYWVQYPGTAAARWRGPDTSVASWNWAAQSDDPREPALPGQAAPSPSNGVAAGHGIASASARFTAAAGMSYSLEAALLGPNNYVGNPDPGADLVRIGWATGNALADNLDASGVAWVVLRSNGVFELHTGGVNAAAVSEQLGGHTPQFNSLEHVTITYDAGAGLVRARTDGGAGLSLPLAGFAPQYVGMDVRTVTNDSLIATVGYVRVSEGVVPEPAGAVVGAGAGVMAWARRRRRGVAGA